ncbi:MAG: cell division protein FtsZ, partial [Terriglobales bacterium]
AAAHEDANIIFGATLNESMQDQIKITVIATGFRAEYIQSRAAAANAPAPPPAAVFTPDAPPLPSPATPHPAEDDLDVPAFLRLGNSAAGSGN